MWVEHLWAVARAVWLVKVTFASPAVTGEAKPNSRSLVSVLRPLLRPATAEKRLGEVAGK
jgi:hypothetical protein